MTIVRFIGDVHGKYRRYKRVIESSSYPSVQIGDMGVGFIRYGGDKHGIPDQNPPHRKMAQCKARFIRGNHDALNVCKKHSQWIKDGTVEDNIMYVGGALSVDRQWRIEGYSWWSDEELSYQEFMEIISIYETVKPEIIITHDTCTTAAAVLCSYKGMNYYNDGSRTRSALEQCLQISHPKLWIFGHWHTHFDHIIDGCRFICLPELYWADIDLSLLKIINEGQG